MGLTSPSGVTTPSLCPNGKEYSACMTYKTCENVEEMITLDVCEAGCQCTEGRVAHNGTCIDPSNCPCYDFLRQRYYKVRTCNSSKLLEGVQSRKFLIKGWRGLFKKNQLGTFMQIPVPVIQMHCSGVYFTNKCCQQDFPVVVPVLATNNPCLAQSEITK